MSEQEHDGKPKGNPKVLVRIDRDTLEAAQAAFPATHGAPGGVAFALRRLLHLALDSPMPRQHGEPEDRADPVADLEERARLMETGTERPAKSRLDRARDEAAGLLASSKDPVDLLRLRAVLGRLSILRSRQGDR